MKKSRLKMKFAAVILILAAAASFSIFADAAQSSETSAAAENSSIKESSKTTGSMQRYYFDKNLVNAGLDTGFTGKDPISGDDPHFGWELGKFNVTGYTRVTDEDTAHPVFLKTVGDKVTLWFKLDQDINKLNGDENMTIFDDANGYDEYFGITKTEFNKGTLIVRHSNYQNKEQEPVIYTNYLQSKTTKGTDTTVELFEEGDYEVALDYEIEKVSYILGIPKKDYYNYRISFEFSVRNGNCMVYPFDIKTKEELTNKSITPNGFYLDLAKSRYLDIDIKKEVLKDGADGLVEDVRFNAPAKDGDKYTTDGIYTITVSNRYTTQRTEKKIYVGDDNLLKAYITTGLSISEIRKKVENGARINNDGTIVTVAAKPLASVQSTEKEIEISAVQDLSAEKADAISSDSISKNEGFHFYLIIAAGAAVIAIAGGVIWIAVKGKRKKQ